VRSWGNAALDAPGEGRPHRRARSLPWAAGFFAALALFAPTQASALACFLPDAVQYYLLMRESGRPFLVVHGTFAADARAPDEDTGMGTVVSTWTGRLTGTSLGPDGFGAPIDTQITYRYLCFGTYECPESPPASSILAFVELTLEGPVVTDDICGNAVIADPSPEEIARIEECQRSGKCIPKQEK
jgi:hypothetical protein